MANKPPFPLPYAHPAVRDLAFLLSAPSPWLSGADIPPQRLLGADGPALLQALDADPAELQHWLARQPTRRLGHYAERLLSFWFRLAPHIELVASNLPVRDADGRTVGEFDFLLRLDGQPLHLEAASKFYLQLGRSADTLTGPSLRDAWALKARKLQTQLRLSRHPAAQAMLPAGFDGCAVGARLSGWLFHARDTSPQAPPGARPLYGQYWPLRGDWPALNADSRWAWLPRLSWLAPARLGFEQTHTAAALRAQLEQAAAPQLLAELQAGADGCWHEVARGFAVPPGWPQEAPLSRLLQQIAGSPSP
ncbi:DUF1853 family protein [Chromobacterium alkanivorans]|uniref:DUF1853 family protein n=1 Tax=Chromobacterium haemolyticum TaxID=394935 RepID=A0ABS3GSA4_9NEIS|nr:MULTISPECIES: DUF1853 family protein [Chromobacterium]MBK0416448.1 DUF1853 family protein [Chromobacterium haemolyticum]MBN3005878.1 DUF1853 family protein [Chromobacterium alkanivorans]MBO0417598.1 DUF1853 family protein [Chromobacterium haemolyticum]MBO0500790.1 DUF1853 family protein [Chromobacterium haemolyticum]